MSRVRLAPLQSVLLVGGLVASSGSMADVYPGGLTSQLTDIEPAQPLAGTPFRVNVLAGPCEYLNADPNSATQVSLENGVVTIRIPGALDISCNQEITPRQFILPGLPPGEYRVDLVLYMVEFPGDHGIPSGYIGGRDVQVLAAASPATIPTLHTLGVATLAALALLLGSLSLKLRTRNGGVGLLASGISLVALSNDVQGDTRSRAERRT